jgi:hypothetical protein
MRTIGMFAVSGLALMVIGEGVYIAKLSRRIDALSGAVGGGAAGGSERSFLSSAEGGAFTRPAGFDRRAPAARPAAPILAPAAASPPSAAAAAASASLGEALGTVEGRQHLKGALAVIREEERQSRLVRVSERDREREGQYRERLTKVLSLPPDDQRKLGDIYANLDVGRQRLLEEMRTGLKDAETADGEIDNLEEVTNKAVRTLLGDARMKQFRDAERAERGGDRGRWRGRGNGNGNGNGNGQQPGGGPSPGGGASSGGGASPGGGPAAAQPPAAP